MGIVDELKTVEFWESPESCVLVNPRSGKAKEEGSIVESRIVQRDDLEGCVFVATSGSNGKSRFVCLAKSSLLESAASVNQHLRVSSEDRWLCALPHFHVGGLAVYARAVKSESEMNVYEKSWNPKSFCDELERLQTTLTSLVPTQIYDLVSNGCRCPERVRAVVVGGERLEDELGQKARRLGWPVLQSYGLTEAGSQVATQSIDSLQEDFSGEWLDVLSGWQVRLSHSESHLEIKGEALCQGFFDISKDGQANYTVISDWFTTNDVVETRDTAETTQLRVLGRRDDVIKILGEQVSLGKLNLCFQSLLREQEGKVDGALLVISDERKGHKIVAAIKVTERPLTVQNLIDTFNEQVEPYERIDEVRIVNEIPRSDLGKVKRQDLMMLYENGS